MSTDNQIQAKRDKVDALRGQRDAAKLAIANANTNASRDIQLASLDAEESRLQAELASLRATAPAPTKEAPASPKSSSPDAASTKE